MKISLSSPALEWYILGTMASQQPASATARLDDVPGLAGKVSAGTMVHSRASLQCRLVFSALKAFVVALAVIFACGAVVFVVMWLVPPPSSPAAVGVEEQWKRVMGQYNLDPVYPPEEDFAVGDLFVEVVNDKDPDPNLSAAQRITEATPFNKRALKLAHVNVKKDLEAAYNDIPYFGSIVVAPPASGTSSGPISLWAQEMGALPIAAFPDLATHSASEAEASVFFRWLRAFGFGAASAADSKVTLHALTYGLPNASADGALASFCSEAKTAVICTEKEIRRQVRSLIGPHAESEYLGQDLRSHYSVEIRCFMVIRVFLATDIATQTSVERALSGNISVSSPPHSEGAQSQRPATAVAPGNGSENQPQMTELMKRVALLEERSRGTAEAGRFATSSSQSMELRSTFTRPVAVGYLPMLFEPKPSDP